MKKTAEDLPSKASPLATAEEDIARTRQRMSRTLAALQGEVRDLLDPDRPLDLAGRGPNDAVALAARGIRTAASIKQAATTKDALPLKVFGAVSASTAMLLRYYDWKKRRAAR